LIFVHQHEASTLVAQELVTMHTCLHRGDLVAEDEGDDAAGDVLVDAGERRARRRVRFPRGSRGAGRRGWSRLAPGRRRGFPVLVVAAAGSRSARRSPRPVSARWRYPSGSRRPEDAAGDVQQFRERQVDHPRLTASRVRTSRRRPRSQNVLHHRRDPGPVLIIGQTPGTVLREA
jgi:hypothetical protein